MIKKMLMNEEGEISLAKLGTVITSIAGMILMIPTLDLQVIAVPAVLTDLAKIAAAIGGGTALIGFRDAMGKGGKK